MQNDFHAADNQPPHSDTSSLAAGAQLISSNRGPAFQPVPADQIPVNLATMHSQPASRWLDERLALLGLVRLPTLANGGCFPSALTFTARRSFLTDDQDVTRFPSMAELHFLGEELRNTIIEYIRQWAVLHPDAAASCFSRIIQDPDYENLSGFEEWLQGQEGSCSYTDEVFMDFAAEYLGCSIFSMWSSSGRWRVYPRDGMPRRESPPILVVFIEAPHGGVGHFEILATSTTSFAEAHNTGGLDLFDDHAQPADSHVAPSAVQQRRAEREATASLNTQATTAADARASTGAMGDTNCASAGTTDMPPLGHAGISGVQSPDQQDRHADEGRLQAAACWEAVLPTMPAGKGDAPCRLAHHHLHGAS